MTVNHRHRPPLDPPQPAPAPRRPSSAAAAPSPRDAATKASRRARPPAHEVCAPVRPPPPGPPPHPLPPHLPTTPSCSRQLRAPSVAAACHCHALPPRGRPTGRPTAGRRRTRVCPLGWRDHRRWPPLQAGRQCGTARVPPREGPPPRRHRRNWRGVVSLHWRQRQPLRPHPPPPSPASAAHHPAQSLRRPVPSPKLLPLQPPPPHSHPI